MTTAMGPPPTPSTNPASDALPADETSSPVIKAQMGPPPPKNPSPPPQSQNSDQPESDSSEEAAENNAKETSSKQHQSQGGGFAVPYTIPPWSGAPCHQFQLEVLKDGAIVDQFNV